MLSKITRVEYQLFQQLDTFSRLIKYNFIFQQNCCWSEGTFSESAGGYEGSA